ncbi:MAG: hypothetical protein FWD13_06505 [Treponema sp.]|nr:hypothetical protein [Treponema sp.]
MAQTVIAPKLASTEDLEFIEELWKAFIVNYRAFRDREMVPGNEANFRLISSPGPLQYNAFVQFLGHFENEEQTIWEDKCHMYMHDLANMEESEPAILEFLKNLNSSDYNPADNETVMVTGQFWGDNIEIRKKIIEHLIEFYKNKKAKIQIFSQAKEDKDISSVIPYLDSYQFDMSKRIPIHFVLAGEEYLFFEFPHTESSIFRLNMFLDLNNIKYKRGKTKKDLLNFLEAQIVGAVL